MWRFCACLWKERGESDDGSTLDSPSNREEDEDGVSEGAFHRQPHVRQRTSEVLPLQRLLVASLVRLRLPLGSVLNRGCTRSSNLFVTGT